MAQMLRDATPSDSDMYKNTIYWGAGLYSTKGVTQSFIFITGVNSSPYGRILSNFTTIRRPSPKNY